MTEIEEHIAHWLRNHEPDGYGNGSIGETALWHFVKDLQRGHIDVESRTEDIQKAIDIKYYGEQKLLEVAKNLVEANKDLGVALPRIDDTDARGKIDAILKRMELCKLVKDVLGNILIK